jgi:hypothetical protein
MVNLTRAKDAAMSLAMEVLNGNWVASRVAAPPQNDPPAANANPGFPVSQNPVSMVSVLRPRRLHRLSFGLLPRLSGLQCGWPAHEQAVQAIVSIGDST